MSRQRFRTKRASHPTNSVQRGKNYCYPDKICVSNEWLMDSPLPPTQCCRATPRQRSKSSSIVVWTIKHPRVPSALNLGVSKYLVEKLQCLFLSHGLIFAGKQLEDGRTLHSFRSHLANGRFGCSFSFHFSLISSLSHLVIYFERKCKRKRKRARSAS